MDASTMDGHEPGRTVEPPDGDTPQPRDAPGTGPGRAPTDTGGADDDRAELRRYRALVEYAPDAVVILDLDTGRFVTVNRAAEELFGMSRAELLQVGPAEVSPPEQPDGRSSREASAAQLERALAGERPRFDWTHRRADGTDVPCEVTLLRLPDPERRLVRGSLLDVTERRATETALAAQAARRIAEQIARRAAEASVARLQATVAGLNAIVWERDPATLRLTFVNERAEELLGYPASRWLADEGLWSRILHPDDRDEVLDRVRREVDAGAVDFTLTYRVCSADGRWVWLQHLGHVARDEDGTARTLHAVLFDVTEARRRERAAELLAAAAAALAAPGAVEDRLAAVAALAVEELADRALVWLRGDDDRHSIVAAAPADAAPGLTGVPLLVVPEELRPSVEAGQPFVVGTVTEALRDEATGRAPARLPTDPLPVGPRLVVPLVTGGERVGLLSLAVADPGRRFDDADRALAGDLGRLVATTVAAERLAERQRQLHDLAVALAAAGTAAEAGAELTARLHESLGAAVVAVCALGEDGLLHTVDVHGDSPGWTAGFSTIRLSAPAPLAEAARTRRPVWLPDREALVAGYPEMEPFLRPGTQATASLPLLAGPRLVGAVAVVFDRPRAFDAAERAFLLTVAGQVAGALERAALADVRREMADTLQRSLLPARLPTSDRLTVTARYLPAVTGTSAGGDWHEVVPVPGERTALVVGDVVGHGASAAAVMGRLSSALSGVLLTGEGPARALELLDGFAGRIDGAALATVACLVLDPATGRLTASTAGHPPPLLVAPDGSAVLLDGGHGPALGVAGTGRRPETVSVLPAGATLLLYTDGLVERRGSLLDEGLARLAAAAGARATAPLPALVDGVLTDLLGGGHGADDDVAVLAARLHPAPLRLELPADPLQLARLRREVSRWAGEAALSPDATGDLQLAVGEAAANAVEHAYRDATEPGRVLVELVADPDGGVAATVTDGGTWQPAAADRGFRGRGLDMIAALAGGVDVLPGPGGTALRFRLAPPGPVPPPAPGSVAAAGAPAVLRAEDEPYGRRLELAGDLDLAGVTEVRTALLAEVTDGRPLLLDLTRLGFVASVGAGLLLEAARTAGGHLEVVLPPGGSARRLLDLTGLSEVLTGGGAPATR
ncbi:SpoIIE family protein phosphatase [Geodermatophilus sp. SYSU D01062]